MKKIMKKILVVFMCFTILSSMFVVFPTASTLEEINFDDDIIADTEDTITFGVPITSTNTRGIFKLEVSLTGSTSKKVTATVKNTFALGFSEVSIKITLYSYRTYSVARASAYDSDLNLGESMSVSTSTNDVTAKYYAVLTGTVNGETLNYSTYYIPFNKRGEKYPTDIKSDLTGQSLPYGFSVTATEIPTSEWVPWTAKIRKEYAEYLGKSLTGYEVHHILPRRYGGTNSYSNLIPLTKSDHTKVTNWWNYYK